MEAPPPAKKAKKEKKAKSAKPKKERVPPPARKPGQTYCLSLRKYTFDVPGSQKLEKLANGHWRVRSVCAESGKVKSTLVRSPPA